MGILIITILKMRKLSHRVSSLSEITHLVNSRAMIQTNMDSLSLVTMHLTTQQDTATFVGKLAPSKLLRQILEGRLENQA